MPKRSSFINVKDPVLQTVINQIKEKKDPLEILISHGRDLWVSDSRGDDVAIGDAFLYGLIFASRLKYGSTLQAVLREAGLNYRSPSGMRSWVYRLKRLNPHLEKVMKFMSSQEVPVSSDSTILLSLGPAPKKRMNRRVPQVRRAVSKWVSTKETAKDLIYSTTKDLGWNFSRDYIRSLG